MCVDTTVRAAKNFGYNITLMEDACATKDLTYNGNLISAATVGNVYMASLKKTFAKNRQYWKMASRIRLRLRSYWLKKLT